MPEHVGGNGLDVLGTDVVASLEPGVGASRAVNSHAGARAGAIHDLAVQRCIDGARFARCDHYIDDIFLQFTREVQAEYVLPCLHDRCRGHLRRRLERIALAGTSLVTVQYENPALIFGRRIVDLGVQEEAVELRLGKRVRALLFDRVLRRHDHEQVVQRVTPFADRDLALLHGLQQRGLDFCRRAVDFVCQDQVMEQRPFAKLESTLLGTVYLGPGQVGRQEIRGELQPVEVALDAFRQHLDRTSLGKTGRAFNKQMPIT